MQRLFIADPSLVDQRGHHFTLTRNVSRSAAIAGFQAIWLCSSSAPASLAVEGARLRPTFGASMYHNYVPSRVARQSPVRSFFAKLFEPKGNVSSAPSITPKVNQAQQLEADLRAAIEAEDIGPNDRLLLHTADGATYAAVSRIVAAMGTEAAPIFHVVTPYDPVGIMPNRKTPEEVGDAIFILNELGALNRKVFLYGENDDLAAHLSTLWSAPVRAQELPISAPDETARRRAAAYRRNDLGIGDDTLMIISLGAARLEKGFNLFPEIIRETFKLLAEDAAKARYVLHASPQIIGRVPAIAAAIDSLQALPGAQVSLLVDPLTDEQYQDLLLASDAVMLPYVRKDYLVRSSGIVAETIAAGKILIATKGSYPGRMAEAAGGIACDGAAEFAEAAATLAIDSGERRQAARAAGDAFCARNTIEDYVPKLLRAERSALVAEEV